MTQKEFLIKLAILYILVIAGFLLFLTNCAHKTEEVHPKDTIRDRGTCVRIGPKGTEIIEPCWR